MFASVHTFTKHALHDGWAKPDSRGAARTHMCPGGWVFSSRTSASDIEEPSANWREAKKLKGTRPSSARPAQTSDRALSLSSSRQSRSNIQSPYYINSPGHPGTTKVRALSNTPLVHRCPIDPHSTKLPHSAARPGLTEGSA